VTDSDDFLRAVAHAPEVDAPLPEEQPERIAHFRIIAKIGRGGMGVVWRAQDEKLGREVALKVLPPSQEQDAERRKRLLREAKAAAALTHPNVATVYEAGEDDEGRVWIAIELVDGESLRTRVAKGALSLDEAVRIFTDVVRGIARCERRRASGHQAGQHQASGEYINFTPTPVAFDPGAVSVVRSGLDATCVIVGTKVSCWGSDNDGQLGQAPPIDDAGQTISSTPIQIQLAGPASSVEPAGCALSAGGVTCWGTNNTGEVGQPDASGFYPPTAVPGVSNIVALSRGAFHTCALTSTGDAYCWGKNALGQLGHDPNTDTFGGCGCPTSSTPTIVMLPH
jgi:hypothetical protein